MFKSKFLTLATVFITLLSGANAYSEDKKESLPKAAEQSQTENTANRSQNNNSGQIPVFPSLVPEGTNIGMGDVIILSRQFNKWMLHCDLWLAGDKRLCAVEQNITSGDDTITWRIMTGSDGRTWGVVHIFANFDKTEGIRMGFSGVEKTLRNPNEIVCTSKDNCTAYFPFEGFIQIAVMKSPTIWFSYYKSGKSLVSNGKDMDEGKQVVTLSSDMSGLMEALNAAATNPYAPVNTNTPTKGDKNDKNDGKKTR